MAPKKDLASLASKEALVEKVAGKRKRPEPVGEERDFHRLRRDPSIPKVVQPATAEKVGKCLPDLAAMMPPPFPLRRSTREGSSYPARSACERIKGALLPDDVKVFKQASHESLIGLSYAFSDFVSEFPSNFVLSFSFLECLLTKIGRASCRERVFRAV